MKNQKFLDFEFLEMRKRRKGENGDFNAFDYLNFEF